MGLPTRCLAPPLRVVDLFIGAPLFMDRGSDGKLREVGQVYVYLGKGGFSFHTQRTLTGLEVYSRFGSCITALGDLDMDGFNGTTRNMAVVSITPPLLPPLLEGLPSCTFPLTHGCPRSLRRHRHCGTLRWPRPLRPGLHPQRQGDRA